MPLKVMIVVCAACVVLGMVGLYLLTNLVAAMKQRKTTKPVKAGPAKPSVVNRFGAALERIGTMNIVLITIGALLIWFTTTMIDLFREYGSVPDTLVNCVFLALTGECGVLGWIKTSKVKHREREWMMADANTTPPTEESPVEEDDPSAGVG